MPNDNLKKYYSYLKSNGADVAPTYEAFANALSDENNAKKYHSYLLKNKFDAPQSYDVFSQKLGIVKKKETTVSPSVQKPKPISSGTQPKGTQKPLGTSVSQKESKPEILFPAQKGKRNDVFTTEDGKTYRLDMSTGKPVWKGYTSSVVKGQGGSKQDYEIYNTIISNPNTVNALNKTFGKQASTSDTDQIYTGLVGKEENQYRVYNDNWQRLTPNSNNWEEVNSEGAISYLNKNYGKNVKVKPTVKKEDKGYQFTDINSQLISKTEEKVVPYLQRQYGRLGFNFEESGLGTDYVKVTSKNGNTIEVSLDENNPEEALKLKSFLQGNKSEIQTDASKKVNDLIREVNRFDLGSDYKKQASKRLDDYRSSEEFVNDLKYMNFNEVESNINSIKNNFIRRNDKQGLEDFYNSSAYKLYKEKQKEDSSVKAEKIDSLYYELKQAKTPEEKKQAKIKIDTYLSDKVINKQSDNYNIQLGDVSESYKKLNAAISQFDKDKADLDQRVNSGNISQEEYESLAESINKRAEYLDSRRQEIKSEKDGLISDMNKLQSITGQYLIDKEKTGSFGGNMLNSLVTGVSKIFEPSMQVLTSVVSDRIMMKLDPDELKMLKAKGYNDEEIKNYTVNKETKKLKEEFRSGLVETFGTSGTTKEYAQSKDRGFFEKSLSGVAESLPGMLAPGGAIVKVGSLGAQAYSSIEDEMLADKDFETTSALDRSVVALPYAIGMGILENLGVSTVMSKNPLAKSLLTKSLLSAVKKVGGDASKEVIESVIDKEIKSNIAKYGIRIVGGALAEAETGALQSAVLDIGLKKLYNSWKDANDGKTAETLTEGEYFSTPDTFMGGLSQVAEDAAAEAIGGWAMTTVGTSAQAIMNKGQISLYNDKDVEFLKGLSTDPEVKKMFIAKLKTNMLQGSMTKSEAQEQLNSLNELESTFSKIPDNITGENLKKSVGLISERNKLTQEIEGKDESLTAVQQARISEINNELKTISENAVKESNIEEVTAEGGGIQREGTQEGQPEVGQGEGAVGQATQPETDLGNRPVEGGRTEEERVTRNVINRPATLSEFGGKTFDTPLQGDTYVDGQQVVFEDRATGRIYELGNIDEVMDSAIPGLQAQEETISITTEGKVSIEGNNWNIQSELPTQGIEYNPAGEVTRVSLKDDAGNTQMFEGQQAVDIAYQIELQKIQSIEQQQFINDLLEQDEEFQTATESIKPRQIEAVVQEETAPDIVPTEPTVAEEVVAEQPVAEEVERLGKLLEGTDQQIDEQIGTFRVSKDNSRVAKSIANAAKSIAKILPDVKFVVHDTDESYRKATGEQGRSQSSSGEYNPKTKTININASKANNRTAAHEVFHAILLNKIGSDIEAQRLTKAMINSVMKSLVNMKDAGKILRYLNDFASNYEKNIQNEEKLAELFGILADGYNSLPYPSKNIIRRFLDRMAKLFGLKPFTDREVIQFMNNVSFSVEAGDEITQKDISFLGNGTIDVTTPRKSKFIDSLVFERFPTNKNTKVIEDFKLSDINGQVAASTLSDKLTAGKLKKVKTVKGQEIVDAEYIFYGGVGYPEVTGYVWASSTKDKVQTIIDSMVVSSDGYRYLIPAIMSNTSHMSNRNMTLITMEVFKEAIANNELNRTKFKEIVSKAFSNKKAEKFKDGALNAVSGNISGNQMCDNLKNYMLSSKMSFESRKDVLKSMVGNPESGNPKFSTVGTYLSLATSLSEPIVKDADMHQVAVVIRTKGNLTPKETDTNDVFYHDSYGFHIESDQEIEVLHLDGIYNLVDVIPEFTTDEGKTVSTKQELKEKGQKGWNIKRILTNLGRTHGLSKYSAEIVSPRKQLIGENANLAQNVRDNLQVARDMEDAGKSVKDIRIATGWERGADKKWRYEIDDIKIIGDKIPFTDNFVGEGYIVKLKDFVDGKILNAYPELGDKITIVRGIPSSSSGETFGSLQKTRNGWDLYLSDRIFNGDEQFGKSTLIHEIQHAIQDIEGFAEGGNVKMMKTPNDVLQNLANKLPSKALTSAEKSLIKDEYEKNGLSRLPILPTSLDVTSDSINTIEDFIDKLDILIKLFPNENSYKNLQDALDLKLMEMGGKNVAFEKYQKLAGEVESRNVQTRMKMTPEERRQTTLQETEDVSREDQIIFFKGQEESIDSAVRKQKADTISGMVFTARQNGFSDAAISQYLLTKGYTQEQIDGALSAKAGTKNIDDIFKASEQEIRDKVKRKSIREFFRSLSRTTLNRQVDIKRALAGLKNKQAQKALARLITKAGSGGLASIRFKIAAKDIYGKLKEADIKVLDKIIYARRIISINENRSELRAKAYEGLDDSLKIELNNIIDSKKRKDNNELNNIKKRVGEKTYKDLIDRSEIYKEPYRGMDGYSEVNAQENLNTIKNEIGEDKFNDLNDRADKYFNVFKENLKKLKESGRITEDVYNDLNEIEYSPIATIKYIISDNMDVSDMDREASRLGMSKDDIKKLTDRNENGIITDSRYLLAMNISSVESRAFENAMLNEVVKALDEATPEQQTALSEYVVFDNPIIGSFKDGRPKRKYDDQAVPSGFKKVYYFENGIEKYIIVREDMARQLLDVKNAKMQAAIENTAKTVPVIGAALKTITLTPARLLRFFATGGNPLFILGNVAVDWVNAVFNTDVYSNLKAYGMVQAGLGFAKNFIKKAVTNDTFNKTYNEFAEHGGLMDFLSNESMRALNELKPGHKIFSPLHKAVEMYGTVMSFLGETSEVAMRLAVYEKMKSNLVSEFKKENGVDPNAQQMDDIMWEAAREARELIDFNQGGSWAKEADVVMPYLNAALQGFRKPLDYAKKNPVGFASSYIQLAGMGASIAAMSLAAAMNAMPSDDDDEEKKKKIRKALDSISDHEKASYHIIFTGKVDKNGELEYIRIKKLPVASVATTLAEQMMYKYLVGYEFDEATFNQTIEKSLPLSISELESKNPVVAGYLTYKYNEDTFTGEKVFRGPKDKVILETAEGVNDPKIEAFYKSVAPVFGLSPARSKAFVEKIITNQSTNPTINIFYAAANGIFGKDTQFGNEFSTAMEKMKEAAGKKLIRYTNENVLKYKKEDELEKEKIYITTEKYLKDSKIKADIKDRYNNGKTMTIGELEKIVKENYDPIDQQKYLKKYYTYTQTMNADPVLLDLLYEDDPNIQALIINDTYGPSLEKEELDELVDVMQKSRRKVSSKAWYIYQTKYKNRK